MSPPIDERSVFPTSLICPQCSEHSSPLLQYFVIVIFTIVITNVNICQREPARGPLEYWGKTQLPFSVTHSLTLHWATLLHRIALHWCTKHCIIVLHTTFLFCTLHSWSAHYILVLHTTFLIRTLHSWSAHYIALHHYTASPYWTASLPCFIALHHSAHGIVQLHCIKCSDTVSCCIFVLLWTALHNCSTLLHCTA